MALNDHPRWLWSAKPVAKAVSASGCPLRDGAFAPSAGKSLSRGNGAESRTSLRRPARANTGRAHPPRQILEPHRLREVGLEVAVRLADSPAVHPPPRHGWRVAQRKRCHRRKGLLHRDVRRQGELGRGRDRGTQTPAGGLEPPADRKGHHLEEVPRPRPPESAAVGACTVRKVQPHARASCGALRPRGPPCRTQCSSTALSLGASGPACASWRRIRILGRGLAVDGASIHRPATEISRSGQG